jgi:hypothetical protein
VAHRRFVDPKRVTRSVAARSMVSRFAGIADNPPINFEGCMPVD